MLGLKGERIGYDWETLRGRRRDLAQLRRVERLRVAASQRECPDILGIHRLPANRYLRLLCIIPAMPRRHGREKPRRQDRGSVGAIPFFSFSEVYFQAVEAREVPCRTCEWHTYF